MAGASVEARLHALKKLRARVKEQAEPDAPDWLLSQSTEVPRQTFPLFSTTLFSSVLYVFYFILDSHSI